MNKHRGILFIAFGERWIEEAKRSMHSVRCVSSLPIAVVTDRIWQDGAKPDYFVTQEKVNGWASKPLYMYSCSPFDQTLFIDTDTIVLSDPEPIFGLLDYYDVGVRFGGPMLSESRHWYFTPSAIRELSFIKKHL